MMIALCFNNAISIMLSYEGRTLIIDAKYYSHTTQVQYDVQRFIQITYIKYLLM